MRKYTRFLHYVIFMFSLFPLPIICGHDFAPSLSPLFHHLAWAYEGLQGLGRLVGVFPSRACVVKAAYCDVNEVLVFEIMSQEK